MLKQKVILLLHKKPSLTDADVSAILLLKEAFHKPNQQGRMELEPNAPLRYKNQCALILRTLMDACGADPKDPFADNGWRLMGVALEVRHRLTHPRCDSDLDVSDDELYAMSEGHRWLINVMTYALEVAWKRMIEAGTIPPPLMPSRRRQQE